MAAIIASVLALLGSAATTLGPAALAGGPLGLVLAGIGSRLSRPATKYLLILIGIGMAIAAVAGLTVRLEHLEQAEKRLAHELALKAEIERMLGCEKRPVEAERELGACILAGQRDAERVRAEAVAKAAREAASAQKEIDDAGRALDTQTALAVKAITTAPASDDGPVPKVLRDAWQRERARRGAK